MFILSQLVLMPYGAMIILALAQIKNIIVELFSLI
jgi:hypothetical protein